MSTPILPEQVESGPVESGPGERKGLSGRTQRILTGLIAAPFALAAVFLAPPPLLLVIAVLAFGGAAVEYVRLVRHWAPSAPLGIVPAGASALAAGMVAMLERLPQETPAQAIALWPILGAGAVVVIAGLAVLLSPVRMPEAMIAVGLIHFGVPYFALPTISVYLLVVSDPWLLALLLFAVWAGDICAYAFGSQFGRHRLAAVISPNKSWEGAAAGLAGSIAVAVVWCQLRLGHLDLTLIAITGLASAAGQVGDLLESMIKRGVGVKDSSNLLPGHGGLFDRLDALMVAAPVFVVALWLFSREYLTVLGATILSGTPAP